jgi:hypothetical protein
MRYFFSDSFDFLITPTLPVCRKKMRPAKGNFSAGLKKVRPSAQKKRRIREIMDLWHSFCELYGKSDRQNKGVTDVGLKQTKG